MCDLCVLTNSLNPALLYIHIRVWNNNNISNEQNVGLCYTLNAWLQISYITLTTAGRCFLALVLRDQSAAGFWATSQLIRLTWTPNWNVLINTWRTLEISMEQAIPALPLPKLPVNVPVDVNVNVNVKNWQGFVTSGVCWWLLHFIFYAMFFGGFFQCFPVQCP